MRLSEIAKGIGKVMGPDVEVRDVQHDSRLAGPGDLYCAIVGMRYDGHHFVADALSRGAVALCLSKPEFAPPKTPVLLVDSVRRAIGPIASRAHGDPSRKLWVCGVTGTNGKTTTTYVLRHLLRDAGRAVDIIGTIERSIGGAVEHSVRTTPEATDLHRWFEQMADAGTKDVVMEVSSHALDLGRVRALHFAGAVFTNLTQDHLDYHGTLERYAQAKLALFSAIDADGFGVINRDDPAWERFRDVLVGRPILFGFDERAEVQAKDVQSESTQTRFTCRFDTRSVEVVLPLVGPFNVQNVLAAAAAAWAHGLSPEQIAASLATVKAPPGRFERIDRGQPFNVIVDYAHTPDGIEKLLRAVRQITPGRVMIVFGCGGDRDREKRPLMGRAAAQLADLVVVTADNPRSEPVEQIMDQICTGIAESGRGNFVRFLDRHDAIRFAVGEARPGDTVVLAGKGHENYQLYGSIVEHFDDREEAARALERLHDA